jgi:hypothetical protein
MAANDLSQQRPVLAPSSVLVFANALAQILLAMVVSLEVMMAFSSQAMAAFSEA